MEPCCGWLPPARRAGRPTLDKVQGLRRAAGRHRGHLPPFSYHDPATNTLTGYDIEVIDRGRRELGVAPEFVEAPFDAIFASLVSDRFDVVANQVTRNARREAQYALSRAVHLLRRGDRHPGRRQLDHQPGRPQGQDHRPELDQQLGRGGQGGRRRRCEAVEGFTQAVTLVKQQRVDATVNDNLAVAEYIKTTGDTSVKIAAETGDTSEQVFALRQDDADLRDAVNGALDEAARRRHS